MTDVWRLQGADFAVATVTGLSQFLMWDCLQSDWQPHLPKPAYRTAAVALFVVWAAIVFGIWLNVAPSHMTRWAPAELRAAVSAIGTLWGFLSTTVMAVYLSARFVLRRLPTDYSPERRYWIKAAAGAALAAPVAATAFGALIERTRFHVKEVDFPILGLHPDFEGLRVAQVSDLHVSPFLSVRDAARAVDMANELRPHLTLVTGDLISEVGDPLDATILELARLRADLGVLGCLGNHEVYAECEDYATAQLRRVGIQVLRHEARALRRGNGSLNVAGVDFQPFRMRNRYLAGAEKLVVPGIPNLLMSHNPDVFPVAVRKGYDGVISGHTHGGQVAVEILKQHLNIVRFFTPFVTGLYRMEDRSCYVTAGVGTIGMPVRLGAPPEITLLRLRRA